MLRGEAGQVFRGLRDIHRCTECYPMTPVSLGNLAKMDRCTWKVKHEPFPKELAWLSTVCFGAKVKGTKETCKKSLKWCPESHPGLLVGAAYLHGCGSSKLCRLSCCRDQGCI